MTGGKVLLGWDELGAHLEDNAYSPLFYFALKAYATVAGTSLAALLVPGMVCALLSAPLLAWAIRPWCADCKTRWWAAALAGFHPLLVLYGSGYAKFYAPMWLLMVVATGLYVRLCDRPRARTAAALVGCVVLATQLGFPALLLPILLLAHALWTLRSRGVLRVTAAATVVSWGLVGLWAARAGRRLSNRAGLEWIPERSEAELLDQMIGDWHWFSLGTLRPNPLAPDGWERLVAVALLVAGLLLVLARARAFRGRRLLALSILGPLVALALFDRISTLYYVRYVGFVLFPAAVLGAAGIRALRGRAAVALATALVAGRVLGFVALGDAPIARDWLTLERDARAAAREHEASLTVLDGFQWTATWRPYVHGLVGEPQGPHALFSHGWMRPRVEDLRPALPAHRRVLLAGYAEPETYPWPPGWRAVAYFGHRRFYSEQTGRVYSLPRFALFER